MPLFVQSHVEFHKSEWVGLGMIHETRGLMASRFCAHFKEQTAAIEFESQAEDDEKNAAQQLQRHTERLKRILALKQLVSQL